jgi:acetolactate synthase-1/2/3 large subunit
MLSYPFDPDELDIPQPYQGIPNLRARPDHSSVNEATQLLKNSKRPLILAGGGVHLSDAAQTLQSFAETFSIPVAHTMTGKGAISCSSPLNAGLFGRYDRIANQFIEKSDCLFVVGCKLGEIATKRFTLPPKNIPVIHLEVVAEEIGRTLQPTVALWGDAKEGIQDLASANAK